MGAYEIRRAEPSDVNEIALAHCDSIQSIGPSYYPFYVRDADGLYSELVGSGADVQGEPLSNLGGCRMQKYSPCSKSTKVSFGHTSR